MDERPSVMNWDKALSSTDPNDESDANTIVTIPVSNTSADTTPSGITADTPDDPAQIRAQIEQTRAGMSETINAISERLNPETLKEQAQEQVEVLAEQAKERVEDIAEQAKERLQETIHESVQTAKDAVYDATIGKVENAMHNVSETVGGAAQQVGTTIRDTSSSVMRSLRRNPLPAVLIGAGLGMLLMENRRRREHDYYGEYNVGTNRSYEGTGQANRVQNVSARAAGAVGDFIESTQETVGNVAAQTRDSVAGVADQARDQVGNITNQVVEQVGNLGNRIQHGAHRAQSQYQESLQENPLAVGAVSLALGAAVGMMLPSTRRENRLMGETRESLTQMAENAARGTIGKIQEVVGEASRAARKEAEYQGLTGGAER